MFSTGVLGRTGGGPRAWAWFGRPFEAPDTGADTTNEAWDELVRGGGGAGERATCG